MMKKKLFSLILVCLSLVQVLLAQQDPPAWDCCALIWSTGCNLGWATALISNTRIRIRWDPADQALVDLLNRAAESVLGAHRACSEMNMAWDNANGKAQWLYQQRDTFIAKPDNFTRNNLLYNLENSYNWGDELKRQVYYDSSGFRQETNFPTCAEKYFKLGYLISKAIQHYRQADEAIRFGRNDWYNEISIANSNLMGVSTILDEYWLVQTGRCVDISNLQPHQRIYNIYTTAVIPQNIQTQIAAIDSIWRDLSNAFFNFCTGTARQTTGVNIQNAQSHHFVGTYDYSDPSRTYSQFHGILYLYDDGRLENDEYINNAYSRNRGKWTYDEANRVLTFDWESNAFFSGPVTGNTNDFTISGNWSNGTAGQMRCVRR
jgi:hypothetical protein